MMKKNKKWSFWKGVGLMFKILGLIVIVAILAPFGYFAWRAGQPMTMPEYDGRTYYELLAERRQAYSELAQEYQASHPNVEVKDGMCFQNEVIMATVYTMPWAGLCTMADLIPSLHRFIGPRAQQAGCGQVENTSWLTFLSSWWSNFERMQYPMYEHRMVGPVVYCRLSAP
jgi:hypothetical protein